MRNTSLKAYLELAGNGEISARQAELLQFLLDHRHDDYSRRELSSLTGIELCSVTGRVNELIKKGLIVEDAPRECRISSKTVHPVRVVA